MPLNCKAEGFEGAFNSALVKYAESENSEAIDTLFRAASELVTPEILARTFTALLEESCTEHQKIFNFLLNHHTGQMSKLDKEPFITIEYIEKVLFSSDVQIVDNYLRFFTPNDDLITPLVTRLVNEDIDRLSQFIINCPYLLQNVVSDPQFVFIFNIVEKSFSHHLKFSIAGAGAGFALEGSASECVIPIAHIRMFIEKYSEKIVKNWNSCKSFISAQANENYTREFSLINRIIVNPNYLSALFLTSSEAEINGFLLLMQNPITQIELIDNIAQKFSLEEALNIFAAILGTVQAMHLSEQSNFNSMIEQMNKGLLSFETSTPALSADERILRLKANIVTYKAHQSKTKVALPTQSKVAEEDVATTFVGRAKRALPGLVYDSIAKGPMLAGASFLGNVIGPELADAAYAGGK